MTPEDPPPASDLAGTLKGISGQLAPISEQLAALQKNEGRLTRAFVVFAAVFAVAVAVMALWNVNQDETRAANHEANLARIAGLEQGLARTQAMNTLFRERICRSIGDWRVYLAQTPAGSPARQAAAGRIITSLESLCPGR
jgi:uncharacterized protein YcaQ